MEKFYPIEIAGCKRQLPICKVDDHLSIAPFVMFSDVEITIACARELLKIVPEFDYIVTAEAKGIPLAYEMSRQSGKNYYPARKMTKLYMTDPIHVSVKSITTAKVQDLYLDKADADVLKGKRILIVDDVISGGDSLRAMEVLVNEAGGNIVGKATVLAEGDAANRDDIIFLDKLPVFEK